jgi:hypothetical protein
MALRRLRGRKFRWGAGFEGKSPFPGAKLRAIGDHCYDFILVAPDPAIPGVSVGRYPFEMFGHGFLLHYVHEERAWVLDIVGWPKRRSRSGGLKKTHAERATPGSQSSLKRNLYSPLLKLVRSQSEQFRVDNSRSKAFDDVAFAPQAILYRTA